MMPRIMRKGHRMGRGCCFALEENNDVQFLKQYTPTPRTRMASPVLKKWTITHSSRLHSKVDFAHVLRYWLLGEESGRLTASGHARGSTYRSSWVTIVQSWTHSYCFNIVLWGLLEMSPVFLQEECWGLHYQEALGHFLKSAKTLTHICSVTNTSQEFLEIPCIFTHFQTNESHSSQVNAAMNKNA